MWFGEVGKEGGGGGGGLNETFQRFRGASNISQLYFQKSRGQELSKRKENTPLAPFNVAMIRNRTARAMFWPESIGDGIQEL